MNCLTVGKESLTRLPHGVAFQLMQFQTGSFIAVLEATVANGGKERHCVAILADFYLPSHPYHRGAIVDNDKRVGVRMLNEDDRTVNGARKVFDDLFWTAVSVRITSVWRVEYFGSYESVSDDRVAGAVA